MQNKLEREIRPDEGNNSLNYLLVTYTCIQTFTFYQVVAFFNLNVFGLAHIKY